MSIAECFTVAADYCCCARAGVHGYSVPRGGGTDAKKIKFEAEERDNGRAGMDSRKTRISWRLPFLRGRATGVASDLAPSVRRAFVPASGERPGLARRVEEDLFPVDRHEGNERKRSPQCPTPWNQDVRAHGCTDRSSYRAASRP